MAYKDADKRPVTERLGSIITRDGLPIEQTFNTLNWFHRNTIQSMEWMIEHEGYGVFDSDGSISAEAIAYGHMEYLLIKSRRGYGVNGWIVRQIENMQEASLGKLSDDAGFAEHVAAPTLTAIRESLNFTDGGNGFDALRTQLDEWVANCAKRFGLDSNEI